MSGDEPLTSAEVGALVLASYNINGYFHLALMIRVLEEANISPEAREALIGSAAIQATRKQHAEAEAAVRRLQIELHVQYNELYNKLTPNSPARLPLGSSSKRACDDLTTDITNGISCAQVYVILEAAVANGDMVTLAALKMLESANLQPEVRVVLALFRFEDVVKQRQAIRNELSRSTQLVEKTWGELGARLYPQEPPLATGTTV